MELSVCLGPLECCYNTSLKKYEVRHRAPAGAYVVLYIHPKSDGDSPDFETVGFRPWHAMQGNEPLDVWSFAKACAELIQQFHDERYKHE